MFANWRTNPSFPLEEVFYFLIPKNMKKIPALLTILALLILPLGQAQSFVSATAQSYLAAHADSPWSTMALSVLGADNIPTDHLKSVSGNSAINYTAPILAIAALGENPRTFGSQDYVSALKSYHTVGQIGDPGLLNDDIFGILALISAGENTNDSAITDAKTFLMNSQNDGGWGFGTGAASDTNTTAAAILALKSAGISGSDASIQNALSYLHGAQNSDGGITYDPQSSFGTDSDSSSTAWTIWALNALGINPGTWDKSGNNPTTYLNGNQAAGGYFSYQPGFSEDAFSAVTTAYAVIALSGKTLPLHIFSAPLEEFLFRIEGNAEQICAGKVPGPTALDIVKNAALICGFAYHISDTSFGPYLDQIGSDTAQGLIGWLYLVNNLSPSVGADNYVLETGDEVLWYYGDYRWLPTRLTLDDTEISAGASATAKVEVFENGAFRALEGATVYYGANSIQTNSNGEAALTPNAGFYQIYAEKDGYVRTNKALFQVGNPESENVNLSVTVNAGQVGGETEEPPQTISFTVNPSNIDFGTLNKGQNASRDLAILNNGTTNLSIETVVSGDDLFKQNLKVGDAIWSQYETDLAAGADTQTQAVLSVPTFYSGGSGEKNGILTFWATAQ